MTNPIVEFFVPGLPAPGGSKNAFGFRRGNGTIGVRLVDAGKRNKPWRAAVAATGRAAYAGPLLTDALDVTMQFVMPRPKHHHVANDRGRPLKPGQAVYHTSKPDALKLARSTEDALTGVVWADDATTVRLTTEKRYGDSPGVLIVVRRIAG